MTLLTSYQLGEDNSRLRRELEQGVRSVEDRVSTLEKRLSTTQLYIKVELRDWLEGLAAAAAFADPFPEPPF